MNSKDIQRLIAKGENERIEFRAGEFMRPELIAKTLCAFLNHGGGRVVLGVGAGGQVVGVSDVDAIVRVIESQLGHLISPWALWTVEQMRVNDRDIVIIDAPEGMDKPYVTGGAIYFRRGAQTVPATRDEISSLIKSRSEASQRWERQIAIGAERQDLNDKMIGETARMAVESQRWQGSPEDIEGFLHALGLLTPSSVSNAALLLFGKQPSRLLPQARVRLVVMPEGKTGNRFPDYKTFDDCLLNVAEQIPAALIPHVGVSSGFSEQDWRREERLTYPISALREGIMNALVHRDYSLSGSITISVFPGSIQISSPGGLPEGLSLADLKRDHPSVPRNPDIAHVFFLRRFIEQIGRGTQRIIEDYRKANLREPKWHSSALETKLTLFVPAASRIGEELSVRQQQILELIREKKQVKAGELVKLLGSEVTDRTVRNDLQLMVDRGWLVRRGQGRSTSYTEGPTTGKK